MILHMSISSSGCWIYMWVSSRIIKKRGMQGKMDEKSSGRWL